MSILQSLKTSSQHMLALKKKRYEGVSGNNRGTQVPFILKIQLAVY